MIGVVVITMRVQYELLSGAVVITMRVQYDRCSCYHNASAI